ncbi:hypothetical protein PENTCL1PPCAC_22754, partial [Pristionchus entomophagus]
TPFLLLRSPPNILCVNVISIRFIFLLLNLHSSSLNIHRLHLITSHPPLFNCIRFYSLKTLTTALSRLRLLLVCPPLSPLSILLCLRLSLFPVSIPFLHLITFHNSARLLQSILSLSLLLPPPPLLP